MSGHTVLGVVFCELDGVLAAPAKSGRADLQVFSLKGRRRRRGTEGLEIVDHAGLSLGRGARQYPGDHVVQGAEEVERLHEDSGGPGFFS